MILEGIYAVSSAWCLFRTTKSLLTFDKKFNKERDTDEKVKELINTFGEEKTKSIIKNGVRFCCLLSVVPYVNTALMALNIAGMIKKGKK